jgi:hypothetical protein
MMAISRFKLWMKNSTAEEKKELAEKAETALSLLYQLSYGTRKASPELAGRLEHAAIKVGTGVQGKLRAFTRGDLSEACAKCHFFKDCQK